MKARSSLYTRNITSAPQKPVKKGKALFGSYNGWFKYFDIKGLVRPFGNLPIPTIFTNLRIKEVFRFMFCSDELVAEIEFFSGGYFSFMETTLWITETQQKLAYRQLLPGGFIHLPKHIGYSVMTCRGHKRYVRIFSRLSKGRLHVDFDFLATGERPICEGRLDFDIRNGEALNYSSVIPYLVNRRCEASYFQSGVIDGWVSLGFKDMYIDSKNAVGAIDFRKSYLGLRTKRLFLTGLGRIDGKMLSFQLSDSISPDSARYNSNILLYDGAHTPLPAVTITRPLGSDGKWVIQDTEGMVDLIFTPLSQSKRWLNALVLKTTYRTIYGVFSGVIMTHDGTPIKLKKFSGIAKDFRLRM